MRLALQPEGGNESQVGQTASLFGEAQLSPHEKKIFALLKADESTHIDEIVERMEPALSSSEIFAALFELELAGKVKQLPGKKFVKSFSLLALGSWPESRIRLRQEASMRNYKDLHVWEKAHTLTLAVYKDTQQFPTEERFGLTSQIRRSCSSIPVNLAGGCGRRWDGEMARFVQIAMSSGAELSYHRLLSRDLGLLKLAVYERLDSELTGVMRMSSSLSQKLRNALES